jgi:hypothetical protein
MQKLSMLMLVLALMLVLVVVSRRKAGGWALTRPGREEKLWGGTMQG